MPALKPPVMKPPRRRLNRIQQPTYFICDACGRTYNTTQMVSTGVCVECKELGKKPSGRARGVLASQPGDAISGSRITVRYPGGFDPRSAPLPTAQDFQNQAREAASEQNIAGKPPGEK